LLDGVGDGGVVGKYDGRFVGVGGVGDVLGNTVGDALGNSVGDVLGDAIGDTLGSSVCETVGDTIGDVDGVGSSTQKAALILLSKSLPDKISVSPSTTLKDPVPYPQQIPSPYESVILKT